MRLAIRHATLAAPARLLFRLGRREFRIDFVEIFSTRVRVPFHGHIAINLHELQHRLLGHGDTLLLAGGDSIEPLNVK